MQDGTALTITAAGDVTVTGDILYNKRPDKRRQPNQYAFNRRRAHPESDQKHRGYNAKCIFRPAICAEQVCATLVSIHHGANERVKFRDADDYHSADELV